MIRFASLRVADRQTLGSLAKVPLVALGARVGRFEPPFEYLQSRKVGFRPADRFLLDRCVAGDVEAINARESAIMARLPEDVSGESIRDAAAAFANYFTVRRAEMEEYFAADRAMLAPSSEPAPVPRQPENLDAILDDVVLGAMAPHGFTRENRKRTKSEWKCRSDIGPVPVELQFDKSPAVLNASLSAPDVPLFGDVASVFFFGQYAEPYADALRIRADLSLFFAEYAKIFPHVMAAIASAIPIRDAFLAGDHEKAIELARNVAPKRVLAP